ncbi:MAG: GntR family transcriptional regulator [Microbacteriaceae bacterium]|jgi:DNA-binding GntR family transcriptional regulator|nr:GntR family transcriptional regulator [Microbacteriaceae bacterium]
MSEAEAPRPDAIYGELRQRILSLTEAPGSTVTESAVALRFGVARPTAKLAIERLVADGLLRRESHRAARVPDLTRDDIVDLFENRAIIEGSAVGRLAVAGAIPSAALDAHRELRSLHDDEVFAALDIEFHRGLVAGQPSQRLARMHALLMGEIELAIAQVQANHLFTATEVARQHQGILDAVTAGDAELAERLTREHITDSRDRLVSHLDSRH